MVIWQTIMSSTKQKTKESEIECLDGKKLIGLPEIHFTLISVLS